MIKKYVLAFLIVFGGALSTQAQNIPNPSFDSVYFGGIDRVFNWMTSDGILVNNGFYKDTVNPFQANTCFDAFGFQFSELIWNTTQLDSTPFSPFAMQITNRPNLYWQDGSHFESFVISGNRFCTDANGQVDLSRCGVPFPHRPLVFKGNYKFIDSTLIGMNSARCLVLLTKWNAALQQRDTIAFKEHWLPLAFTWTAFDVPITYSSSGTPDSISIAFFGTSAPQTKSTLWLDELSFQYVIFGDEEYFADQNSIPFYPNPAAHFIHFKTNQNHFKRCKIYSQTGALLLEKPFSNPLDISELPTGIYVLELIGETSNAQLVKLSVIRD